MAVSNHSQLSTFNDAYGGPFVLTGRGIPPAPPIVFDNNLSFPLNDSYTTLMPEITEISLTDPSPYSSPAAIFGVLVTFSLCTVFGNSLVMLAVKREHYLKSPPNYFVASLAAADFSVGVLIVPFEAITQLLNRRWIFGIIWCDIWRSFDVMLTTASILNLLLISLDRYWAICTPMSYSRRMTSNRAYKFIALVWICSAVISLPAIGWWRAVRTGPVEPDTCPVTEDVGYLISSSCISFYIPLCVMLSAYYKIYLAAVKQSKSIQQGAKLFAHENGTEMITLRMHRGGGSMGNATINSNNNVGAGRKSISFARSQPQIIPDDFSTVRAATVKSSRNSRISYFLRNKGKRTMSESSAQSGVTAISPTGAPTGGMSTIVALAGSPESSGISTAVRLMSDPLVKITTTAGTGVGASLSSAANGPSSPTRTEPTVTFRQTRRSFTVAKKLAKFAKEKKAAKTLAIVLGVFIICWLPFFVTNIVFALCKTCGTQAIFDVTTWLGWINSAINPVIYAYWSQDFRRAFVRLLCCARCRRAYLWNHQRRLSAV